MHIKVGDQVLVRGRYILSEVRCLGRVAKVLGSSLADVTLSDGTSWSCWTSEIEKTVAQELIDVYRGRRPDSCSKATSHHG